MEKETWKAIPGYEGLYEVSDLGNVRSLDRWVTRESGVSMYRKGKVLKQGRYKDGKLSVTLGDGETKKKKYPHILVAEAFIGERPEGYHVCHNDGDCLNNKLSNIRYDTHSQNSIDIYRYGNKSPRGVLSLEQVLEIRRLHSTGNYTQSKLGEMFNVNRAHISNILARKSFSWLNDDGTIQESDTCIKHTG